jgi:hypothetical protein
MVVTTSEGAMGDDKEHDKSLVETTIAAVKEMATSITDAAKHAMEPEPLKPGDKVFLVPAAGDGADPLMSPSPMTPVVVKKRAAKRKAPAKTKTARMPAKKTKSSAGRKAVGKKKTAKKLTKKRKVKR